MLIKFSLTTFWTIGLIIGLNNDPVPLKSGAGNHNATVLKVISITNNTCGFPLMPCQNDCAKLTHGEYFMSSFQLDPTH